VFDGVVMFWCSCFLVGCVGALRNAFWLLLILWFCWLFFTLVCLRALKNASSLFICLCLLALMNALFIFWCFVWSLVFLLFCDDG
jgi:hypothetical protein